MVMMFVLVAKGAAVSPVNLVIGVGAPVDPSSNWANFSATNIISGSSLLPITSTTTVLYIGFTSGTFADIGNMVLYTTKRVSSRITAVTPVKFGGISNPSINLTSKTVCPIQPVSSANPCVVRLDPIALTLSAVSDYYFVTYFTNDSNNGGLGAVTPAPLFINKTSLNGFWESGDDTHRGTGQNVPSGNFGKPFFLMFVMNN
jgi:hypothetical protein